MEAENTMVQSSSSEHLKKINNFLLKAYDPERFSLITFNLEDYLEFLLTSAGKTWELPYIILRHIDEKYPTDLIVLATYGVSKEDVKILTKVTIDSAMATELKKNAFKETDRYIYLEALTNEDVKFDQKSFAKQKDLNSCLASPIVVQGRYVGFIVYLKQRAQGFDSEEVKNFLGNQLSLIIEKIFIVADSFNRINSQYIELHAALEHEKIAGEFRSERNAALAYHYVGKNYFRENIFDKAGDSFLGAAKRMLEDPIKDREFIIRNYLESALAYACSGNEDKSKNSYSDFKIALKEKGFDTGDNFYFDKLIRTLDEKGLDDFAGKVYVDKMRLKVKNKKCSISKMILWIWGNISDYGENWGKWLRFVLLTIFIFALIYMPCPWGEGYIELRRNNGPEYPFKTPPLTFDNFITSLSFVVTVFTTLGFGDITPNNIFARIVVGLEVIIGYGFLGIFITLVSRKFVRK